MITQPALRTAVIVACIVFDEPGPPRLMLMTRAFAAGSVVELFESRAA
jgi:hypothetical protein